MLFISNFVFAQSHDSLSMCSFKWYVSPGISYSNKLYTYSMEGGVWNNTVWIGMVTEFTMDSTSKGGYAIDVGPKLYRKVYSVCKFDLFLYGAVKMMLDKNNDVIFEPGSALLYNVSDKCGLQLSFSSPIMNNSNVFNPVVFSTGFGINWFF